MRITSLSPAVTEILFALKKQRDIVCVDRFSNWPEEAKDIPHLKDHVEIPPQEVQAFTPEIVFTSTVIQQKLAEELCAVGLPVIHQDPRTINQVYESIRQLGMLLNCEPESEQVIRSMQEGFNAVKQKAKLLPSCPKLYIEEWPALPNGKSGKYDPPYASGNWVPEVARIAGGIQFPIPDGELSRAVTFEEVQAFDPDLIVISWCGAGALAEKNLLVERPGWQQLRAVEQRSVRVIDDSLLNRPGPRLVEGAQRLYGWMFELLH